MQKNVYRGGWVTLPSPVLLPVQETFLLKEILLHQGPVQEMSVIVLESQSDSTTTVIESVETRKFWNNH